MKDIFSITAGILSIIALIPYIKAIRKGLTIPAKASWVIWAFMDTVIVAGMYFSATLNGQMVGTVIGAWTVFFFAVKYGIPGWTKLDKICLGATAVSLALWALFKNPFISVVVCLLVASIGCIPTYVSLWKDPSKENKLAWTMVWASSILQLIGLKEYTLANLAQPGTFFILQLIIIHLLFVQPRLKKARSLVPIKD